VRAFAAIRAVGIAGLGTTAALTAHAGGRIAADPLWLSAALAGALIALGAARLCWRLLCDGGDAHMPVPLPLLAAAMLGVQLGAHCGLLVGGAPAHTGAGGSLALHALFALAVALVVRLLEQEAQRALEGRARIHPHIADASPRPLRCVAPAGRLTHLPLGGRAPPEPA
jgi:hypothetical protein